MNVLYVTNMYPILKHKYYGIHVKEQIDSILENCQIESDLYFINGFEKKTNYFRSIFSIWNLLNHKHHDIIHIHFGLSGLFLLFFKPKTSKIVLTLHGSDFNTKQFLKRKIMQKIFQKVDGFIVVNDLMLNRLKETFAHVAKIPCGINMDFFHPTENRINNKNTNKFLIGFPGDPKRHEKNYPLFKAVIASLESKGLEVEVCIFNNLERSEVRDNLNKIDLLLLTSHSEGSPQIIKEALSCNTPIVSVPVGDVSQVITGTKNCIVTDGNDVEQLARASIKILKKSVDPDISGSISGRERITEIHLDNHSVSKKIVDFYKTLV